MTSLNFYRNRAYVRLLFNLSPFHPSSFILHRLLSPYMPSRKGQFLVASPALVDPNFARAVILLVQHDDDAALGVILNRPLEITVAQACEQTLETTCAVTSCLHQGGPCDGPLMALHTRSDVADTEVIPGVYFTTRKDNLEQLLEYNDPQTKFFAGYSGWGAGQLETELETGSWLTTTASKDFIFTAADPWSKLNTRITLSEYIHPDRIPEDPSVN
jgi:putative transcriptional regulator